MRLKGPRPKKFQMGGGAGGTMFAPNPMAQQLGARGALPTAAPGAGATSPFGVGVPGGMPPPGGIGMPPGGAGMPGGINPQQLQALIAARQAMAGGAGPGNFQPRPGMGWGAAPGAGAMGVPAAGATGMAGAGVMPGAGMGMPGAGAAGMGPQQQALMGALSGRGTGVPMGGAMGLGFAEGGEVDTSPSMRDAGGRGHRFSEFDSIKPAPDNLPTHGKGNPSSPIGMGHPGKLAKGGVLRRKPKAATAKEDRRSPSPVPYYDTAAAGTDGWPPTPSFTGAPGPNLPPPVPNPSPQALAPGMARGGRARDDEEEREGMAEGGKWIAGAIKHPGALHKQLGVPQGEKIPAKKLAKAAQAGGKLGQRAQLAQTLKGFKKARGGKCVEDTDKDGMRKGGECDKMAAGGAAKQRKHYPDTIPPPKRMAKGGTVRGSGIAERGTRFSGIY